MLKVSAWASLVDTLVSLAKWDMGGVVIFVEGRDCKLTGLLFRWAIGKPIANLSPDISASTLV